jgi:RNA-directed DNA polymerase
MPGDIYPLVSVRKLRFLLRASDLSELCITAGRHYNSFDIWKGKREDGSDKWRHIDNPADPLRTTQDNIYKKLLKPIAEGLPDYLTGGMPKRSIKDNAYPHLQSSVVLGLDIENCFPSISNRIIFEVWRNRLGCSDDVGRILTQLTTFQRRLPQGAPTSPILCNLALRPLAEDINRYAVKRGLVFTIYVDDITLSGESDAIRSSIKDLIPLVEKHGLRLNKEKFEKAIMDSNEIQKTTGILVNKKMTIPRKKLLEIRREIARLGELGNVAKTYELNSVWGKIQFVKSIDEKNGESLKIYAMKHLSDIVGTPATKPGDRTRVCKNYRRKH